MYEKWAADSEKGFYDQQWIKRSSSGRSSSCLFLFPQNRNNVVTYRLIKKNAHLWHGRLIFTLLLWFNRYAVSLPKKILLFWWRYGIVFLRHNFILSLILTRCAFLSSGKNACSHFAYRFRISEKIVSQQERLHFSCVSLAGRIF